MARRDLVAVDSLLRAGLGAQRGPRRGQQFKGVRIFRGWIPLGAQRLQAGDAALTPGQRLACQVTFANPRACRERSERRACPGPGRPCEPGRRLGRGSVRRRRTGPSPFPKLGWPHQRPVPASRRGGRNATVADPPEAPPEARAARAAAARSGSAPKEAGAANVVLASTPSSAVDRPAMTASGIGLASRPSFRCGRLAGCRAPPTGPDPGQHLITGAAAQKEKGKGVGIKRVGDEVTGRRRVFARVRVVRTAATRP